MSTIVTPTFDVAKTEITRHCKSSGAKRGSDAGRGLPSLLPFEALSLVWKCFDGANTFPFRGVIEVSKVYQSGAEKYDARNWEKGMPFSWFVDSAMRHAEKAVAGKIDEPHFGQIAFNLLGLLQMMLWVDRGNRAAEFADLPNHQSSDCTLTVNMVGIRFSVRTHFERMLDRLWRYMSYGDPADCVEAVAHSLIVCELYYGALTDDYPRGVIDLPRVPKGDPV